MSKKVSVIIPSRNERFMPQTVADIYKKATGEIEVLVMLDGYWPDPILPDYPNLTLLHVSRAMGMRNAINSCAAIATGDYLMKADGHCMFAEGFDEVLKADMEDDWVVIPRRHRLDAEKWDLEPTEKPPIDYHYLSCPMTNKNGYSMHGAIWPEYTRTHYDTLIDDTMSFQGSFWFMTKKWFHTFLGGMSEVGYGSFSQEPQEIGNKTWLGGGRVVVNKKTWYAHLHKGSKYGRGYAMGSHEVERGHQYSAHFWMGNKWDKRIHDFEWLVEKFSPVPTWPENWKELVPPCEI